MAVVLAPRPSASRSAYQARTCAVIQPYSGRASRTSLEIYSRVALADAQESYEKVIDRFPV